MLFVSLPLRELSASLLLSFPFSSPAAPSWVSVVCCFGLGSPAHSLTSLYETHCTHDRKKNHYIKLRRVRYDGLEV